MAALSENPAAGWHRDVARQLDHAADSAEWDSQPIGAWLKRHVNAGTIPSVAPMKYKEG